MIRLLFWPIFAALGAVLWLVWWVLSYLLLPAALLIVVLLLAYNFVT